MSRASSVACFGSSAIFFSARVNLIQNNFTPEKSQGIMGSDRAIYLIFKEIDSLSLWKSRLEYRFSHKKHYFKDFVQPLYNIKNP
jgi:hypothetical protein